MVSESPVRPNPWPSVWLCPFGCTEEWAERRFFAPEAQRENNDLMRGFGEGHRHGNQFRDEMERGCNHGMSWPTWVNFSSVIPCWCQCTQIVYVVIAVLFLHHKADAKRVWRLLISVSWNAGGKKTHFWLLSGVEHLLMCEMTGACLTLWWPA